MFRDEHKHKREPYAFYFDTGGLGDLIATLPAIQYTIYNCPNIEVNFWVPDFAYTLVKKSLRGDYKLFRFSEYKVGKTTIIPGKSLAKSKDLMLSMHLTDFASVGYLGTILPDEAKNYLPVDTSDVNLEGFKLPERFIVVTCNYTTDVREFKVDKVNTIIEFAKSKGCEVILIGKRNIKDASNKTIISGYVDNKINFNKCLDLIDKTTLLEATEIMARSVCIIGVDNGLMHLAATTNRPIVCGFTSVLPEHREPYRHGKKGWNFHSIQPPESLKCRGCQSKWLLEFDNKFDSCYYVKQGLDKEIQCIKQLPVERFIDVLGTIL